MAPAVTLVARVAFATLVCATFAAFFVTQRLKRTPPAVQRVLGPTIFSPNQDGRFDLARISFRLKEPDDVTVDVVDADDDRIRRLADDREIEAYRQVTLAWDGRSDEGRPVPDGTYRYRVGLRREGRSVLLPKRITKDTTPPRPRVLSIGPGQTTLPRPELFPNRKGEPLRVGLFAPGRRPGVLVYRTDVEPARLVLERDLPDGTARWRWDGTVRGHRIAQGTYLVAVRSRDQAGNIGSGPPRLPPAADFGARVPGRGGVSVRYLAAQAPSAPVQAAGRAEFAVVAAGQRYAWAVRRVGEPRPRSRGSGTRPLVGPRAPGGKSGLYLFEVRTRTRRAQVPFVVQSVTPQPVLVVLPLTTWQGRNEVDDDGDGLPDTLERGRPVRTARIFDDDLPEDLTRLGAPLLAHLDREGRRYDLTTDVALARGEGPRLEGHRGVVLAGEVGWLDERVQRSLRRWVRRGGRLMVTGPDSLRRGVTVTARRVTRPQQATPGDLFGAHLRPLARRDDLVLTQVLDELDLFRGTEGQFTGLTTYEETASPGPDARLAATATTEDGERDVIVGARFGDGLVIRTGLPELPGRLGRDGELRAFVRRAWELLQAPR